MFFTSKLIPNFFCVAMLASLVIVFYGCAARQAAQVPKLPAGVKLGSITGQGSEEVIRALRNYTAIGGNTGVLSGRVSISRGVHSEKETVPRLVPSGEPYPTWAADPFTRKLWPVEKADTALEMESYRLQRFTGILTFDWILSHKVGGEQSGRVELDIDRTRGGFLASLGAAPPMTQDASREAMEKMLADELVHILVLDIGRSPNSRDLEYGDDPQSREAKNLAGSGRWDKARDVWLDLLRQNPQYSPALYNLGLYHEYKKEPEAAWEYYRRAFLSSANDMHRAALTRLTESLRSSGRLPTR